MRRIRLTMVMISVVVMGDSCFEPDSQPCLGGKTCPPGSKCTLAGDACVSLDSKCGDGHRDEGELCDDGNAQDGDHCSRDCLSDETCGNGITDKGAKPTSE